MKKLLLLTISLLLFTNSSALSDATALQGKLRAFGYYFGDINGVFDFKTREALRQLMKDKEACPTYVDLNTCGLLLAVQRKIK